MLIEKILKLPGFLYEISGAYYYLGKWICKECTDTDASDCAIMYRICRGRPEEPDTGMYFQKIRAYSDFALDIPYNPAKVKTDLTALISALPDGAMAALEEQVQQFEQDLDRLGTG